MSISVGTIADQILARAEGARRFITAIAGPPGAGKSTLFEALLEELTRRGERAAILPMDGFHMDNGILEERGLLKRKGVPESFDVRGFLDIVQAVRRAGRRGSRSGFRSRSRTLDRLGRAISPQTRLILAEGNYLLLNEAPWTRLAPLFDFTLLVGPPYAVLEERLRARWEHYKLDEEEIRWKLYGNDLPNGERILNGSRPADLRIDLFER